MSGTPVGSGTRSSRFSRSPGAPCCVDTGVIPRLRSGDGIMGTNGCGPWAFPSARPVLRHCTRLYAESTGSAWKPSWALGRRVSWEKHPVLGTKGCGGSGRQDAPGQPEAGSAGRASPLGLCPAPWSQAGAAGSGGPDQRHARDSCAASPPRPGRAGGHEGCVADPAADGPADGGGGGDSVRLVKDIPPALGRHANGLCSRPDCR